jgi:hypothetical protein
MSDVKLPTTVDMLDDYIEKNRLDVFFFLDVSGSCYSYKDRFYAAAKSLDPKRFNLRLFSFDTQVTALDINKWKVYEARLMKMLSWLQEFRVVTKSL